MNKSSWCLMLILSIGVAAYALVAYGTKPLGVSVHPALKIVFEQHPVGIYVHVFASLIALVLGPFQFSSNLRAKHIHLHRWTGRTYLLLGVLLGGIAGLYMAQFAFGGMVSEVGFTAMALLWLFTGSMAFHAIRHKDIAAHRRWMVRNFALTFAAVTLRIYLGLFFASGVAFEEFYPLLAWLSWVPNILLAEWIFNTHNTDTATEVKRSHR